MTMMLAALTVAGSMTVGSPGYAHHSFAAEFDAEKSVTLVGTVTKIEWTNPHAWFYIDVMGEAGKVENWGWELGSPTSLTRLGWTRNALKVGAVVTVEGSRAKDKAYIGNARVVILAATGKRLFAASSQVDTPQQQQR